MKESEFIVGVAEKSDIDAIACFQLAMALETEDKELDLQVVKTGVSSLFDHPEYGFYIACKYESKVVASTMVTFEWSDWRGGLFFWIQSVYVSPEFRRKGIFRLLYDYIGTLAKERGDVTGLRLYVEKENKKAINTYKNMGMSECNYLMFEEEF